jgi:hypothetical protein
VAFEKNGKPVKLQMREEYAQVKMCKTINIQKEAALVEERLYRLRSWLSELRS